MTHLVLNELPDDSGHLIAIEIDDGLVNFDFFEGVNHGLFVSGCFLDKYLIINN